MKYKYIFRLGRGKRALDLLGSSIGDFWNDIYDGFDITKELTVKKLDNTEFTDSEVRKIAGELFDDMEEDNCSIGTEIGNKELYFHHLDTYETFDLNENQRLVEQYFNLFEKPTIVDILPGLRELFLYKINSTLIGVLVMEYAKGKERFSESLVLRFRKDCDKNNVNERLIVTDNKIEKSVKNLADTMDVRIKSTRQLIREMNENLLEIAINQREDEIRSKIGKKFSLGRFNIFFDRVKNARTNMAKKRSLEDLAQYLFSCIEGLEVVSRNARGPSEEVDLIVANESKNEFFRRLGNPLLIECRHRRKPVSSKDIRDFHGKMNSMAIDTALLFSLKGITGDKYDAQSALRDVKKEKKNMVVIDMNDLLEISQGANPITVIRNAFYRFV